MTPAVGHDLLVFGKGRGDLVDSRFGNEPGARNMTAVEGVAAAGIEEHEVVFTAALHGFEHVVALLFGVQLVSEIFLISANIVRGEAHARTSCRAMVTRQLWHMLILLFCRNRRIIGPAAHPKEREYLRLPALSRGFYEVLPPTLFPVDLRFAGLWASNHNHAG